MEGKKRCLGLQERRNSRGQSSGGSQETHGLAHPYKQNPHSHIPPVEDMYQPPQRRGEVGGCSGIPTTNGHHFGNGMPLAPQRFF